MSNPAVYIRNRDKGKLAKKDYTREEGVLLTRYKGTRAKAKKARVPLFDRRGEYMGNLGYPAGQPRPRKGR